MNRLIDRKSNKKIEHERREEKRRGIRAEWVFLYALAYLRTKKGSRLMVQNNQLALDGQAIKPVVL